MLSSAGLEIVMVSRQHYGWASLSYASSEFFRTALFLVPVLFVADLEWLLIGAVAFGGFRLGAGVWYLVREFGRELYSDTVLWKQQLAYALPFEMAVVLEIMQATLHQYAISYNFDAATFAIYSVGCFQIPLVDLMATSAANVMMVKMAGAIRDDRPSTVVAVWHDTTRKLALILFPMVGVLLVNAREIIVLLFTDSYAASVPIFMVWSSTILLAAFPVDGVMRVYAQMRFLVVLNVVRLTLIAGLIGWFLATFQLLGGVLVTVLAMGVARGLGVGRMRKLMGVGISEILPWWTLAGTGASAVAAGVLSVVLKSELEMSMLPLLVVTCVVYAIAYTAGLYVFRVLSEGERLIVRNWLGKWVGASAKTGVLRRS
jgi:O-antigen/teichoic acid export membrane protein